MSTNVDLNYRDKKEFIFNFLQTKRNTQFYFHIYDILQINKENMTINFSGVFVDINKLSNLSIDKIVKLIDNYHTNYTNDNNQDSITYTPYTDDVIDKTIQNLGGNAKLNNFEKNIIKKLR